MALQFSTKHVEELKDMLGAEAANALLLQFPTPAILYAADAADVFAALGVFISDNALLRKKWAELKAWREGPANAQTPIEGALLDQLNFIATEEGAIVILDMVKTIELLAAYINDDIDRLINPLQTVMEKRYANCAASAVLLWSYSVANPQMFSTRRGQSGGVNQIGGTMNAQNVVGGDFVIN
ncbi:hypothetical protein HY947_04620 [Candidatus Gottesmanbacteria bacterium]|nr:hypothetical protein [Candidatus Gottesmanbacteria bacterium]